MKIGGLTGAATLGLWAAYELVHSWNTDRAALATAVHSPAVRETVLITDGVLTRQWVSETLALPKGTSLMALDLGALRDRLLASGQVRVAMLTRSFPDTLVVSLQERSPVSRVLAEGADGAVKMLLVAKDGVTYEGRGYGKTLLEELPWLDGIRLRRAGRAFEPVLGMDEVAALLITAQLQAPHLYQDWLIVSLARFEEHGEIVVRTRDETEVTFSRRRDYFKQVAQLDYVIDSARGLPEANALQSVNLTLDGQVPVRLHGATEQPVPVSTRPARPEFTLQTPSQRKIQRDL